MVDMSYQLWLPKPLLVHPSFLHHHIHSDALHTMHYQEYCLQSFIDACVCKQKHDRRHESVSDTCTVCLHCRSEPPPLDARDDKISSGHHQHLPPSGATYRTCQHLNAEHSKSLFHSSLFTQCIAMSQHLREVVTIEVLSAIVSICRIPPFPNTVER